VVLKVQWDTGASWVGYFLWISMANGTGRCWGSGLQEVLPEPPLIERSC
jgi:hypothetical protein